MLTTLTTDFHLATLQGIEDVASVATMVLCGVAEIQNKRQMFVNKEVAGVVQW
jgi:hypothetical protein